MAVKQCFCGVKQSPHKKSISVFSNRNMYLALAVYLLACISAANAEVSCSNVKNTFEKRGILTAVDIVDQPISDAGELCLNMGCCAASSRSKLMQNARAQLESSLRSELTKLADILASRAKKFDEFFKILLQQSREEFHAMFKRTYGMIYEQHSYVFQQLFEQLERYYAKGDTDLDSMIENFFGILYQKMFTVLNSQYTFDEKYLKCVSEHMRDTQPFEDVPRKLSVQLRRAFVATRTFHKSLSAGADVVRSMTQVPLTQECITAWARLRHCGTCGDIQVPACGRYCQNVLRGCLASHADIAQQWDAYVDAIEKVADRLLGPFNIVMVVEPIDIKISEAIMNFQEHNQDISQKIFAGCGKPVLGGAGGAGPFFSPDRSRRSPRSISNLEWNVPSDFDDFELEASFESLVKEDPNLYSLNSRDDIEQTARKLEEQSRERKKYLQYMRDDVEEEDGDRYRRKREASPEPARGSAEYGGVAEGKRGKKKKPASRVDSGRDVGEWGSPALERLVRESRQRARSSRRYWAALPYVLCGASPQPASQCYNGTATASYTLPAAGEGTAALPSNPELRAAPAPASPAPPPAAAAAAAALRALTQRLKDAYNGAEVRWREEDDLQPSASIVDDLSVPAGSGSGDDGLPDDDEDRDVGQDFSGSGEEPPDDTEADTPAPPPPPPPSTRAPSILHVDPPLVPQVFPPTQSRNLPQPTNEDTPAPDIVTRPPIRQQPATDAAPSLQKALFTYALPVVCAWFGTIVTDLF